MKRSHDLRCGVLGNPFVNVMTCVLGAVMAAVLLSLMAAAQMKILVPTPMEHRSGKTAVYVECRDNELFVLPVRELRKLADGEFHAIAKAAAGDNTAILKGLSQANVRSDIYKVDLSYALTGQFAVTPLPRTHGYRLDDMSREKATDWFGRVLTGIDRNREMLVFLVRDDSFDVFARARALAGVQGVDVSYELLDVGDPIKFGLGGAKPMVQ